MCRQYYVMVHLATSYLTCMTSQLTGTYVSPVLRHGAPGDVIFHLYDVTPHLDVTI